MASSAASTQIIDFPDLSELTALGGDTLETLQRRVLPGYLMRHRWYGAKDAGAPAVTLVDKSVLDTAEGQVLLTTLLVRPPGSAEQRYFLPLAIVSGRRRMPTIPPFWRKSVRAFLIDAFARDTFVSALIEGMREGRETGGLRFLRSGGDLEGGGPDRTVADGAVQHLDPHRREGHAEGLPQAGTGHPSGTGGRAFPDRGGPLPQHPCSAGIDRAGR